MASLFERLNALHDQASPPKAKKSEPKSQPQAQAEPPPMHENKVTPNLKALGDATGINPPPPAGGLPTEVQEVEVAKPEGDARPAPVKAPASDGEQCPYCTKTFKHLSRHRCSQKPVETAQEQAKPAETKPKSAMFPTKPQLQAQIKQDEEDAKSNVVIKKTHGPNSPPPIEPDDDELELVEEESAGPPLVGDFGATETASSMAGLTGAEAPNQEEQGASAQPDPSPQEEPRTRGFVLMLDAVFEKNLTLANGVQHFSDIIEPFAKAVARENQVAHWGCVDYAKGGPQMAAKLERWLIEAQPEGVIIADGSTPEVRACKEALRRHAGVIVQGVR